MNSIIDIICQHWHEPNKYLEDIIQNNNKTTPCEETILNGIINYKGLFSKSRDYILAKKYFEESLQIDKDNSNCLNLLGLIYSKQKDYIKAREYFEKSVELGNVYAMFNLAIMYRYGWGVQQDGKKTVEILENISENLPNARNVLAEIYEEGKIVIQNSEKAVELYKIGVEKKDCLAMSNLGMLYAEGKGVEKDMTKAIELFEQAIQTGNSYIAMYNLATFLCEEKSIYQDYEKAFFLFNKAIEYGDITSIHSLGRMYEKGLGVEKNYAQAKSLYKKAVDLGETWSMIRLGKMYETGEGGHQNYYFAVQLYTKALVHGDIWAKDRIAELKKTVKYKQDLQKIKQGRRLKNKQ